MDFERGMRASWVENVASASFRADMQVGQGVTRPEKVGLSTPLQVEKRKIKEHTSF